ncbi:hypothetical protein [Streptomyces sp. NPDC059639]|uniref:hypothetical protein n=1 Tax=Streptomyces sp. NPDC059639 TaxID=3346891 RepID=UPI0036816585
MGSGAVGSVAARHHIRVPGDDHAPVAVAGAVVQMRDADPYALDAVWVSHEPLG